MKVFAEDMVHSLGKTIRSTSFLETYRTDSKWFSRMRMLAFSFCVCMILSRMVTTLRNELGIFFENTLGIDQSVTPQAFSKARRHIRPEAFMPCSKIPATRPYVQTPSSAFTGTASSPSMGQTFNFPQAKSFV